MNFINALKDFFSKNDNRRKVYLTVTAIIPIFITWGYIDPNTAGQVTLILAAILGVSTNVLAAKNTPSASSKVPDAGYGKNSEVKI